MRTLLPWFIIVLLGSGCHQHEEEFVPIPSEPDKVTPGQSAGIAGSDQRPPITVDSNTFLRRQFKDLPYRLLLPKAFSQSETYPMLIFLHGVGERGTDNEKQLHIAGSYFITDSVRTKYRAFIVYPQCPSNAYWFDNDIMQVVKELIDSLEYEYRIDKNRIAVGGFSMGAYGTFEITSRYPGFFESALAISGDGDESKADRMAESRWKIYAGARDDVVPSTKSKNMAEALERAGASVQFTLFPDADHGSTWVHAFAQADLLEWLSRRAEPSTLSQGPFTRN